MRLLRWRAAPQAITVSPRRRTAWDPGVICACTYRPRRAAASPDRSRRRIAAEASTATRYRTPTPARVRPCQTRFGPLTDAPTPRRRLPTDRPATFGRLAEDAHPPGPIDRANPAYLSTRRSPSLGRIRRAPINLQGGPLRCAGICLDDGSNPSLLRWRRGIRTGRRQHVTIIAPPDRPATIRSMKFPAGLAGARCSGDVGSSQVSLGFALAVTVSSHTMSSERTR